MKTAITISATDLNLSGLTRQLEEDMTGMFNGHIAGQVKDGRVEFFLSDDAVPDLDKALEDGGVFLPFTSPDAEGGMVYANGSPVPFDHDPDEVCFAESDCFGFLITRSEGSYRVEPALCTLNDIGPCCIHHFEVEPQVPNSAELQGQMARYLNRFLQNNDGNDANRAN